MTGNRALDNDQVDQRLNVETESPSSFFANEEIAMATADMTPKHTAPSFPVPSGEHWIEALDNGTHVLIRPLQPKDRQREKPLSNGYPQNRVISASCASSKSLARQCSTN